MADTALDAVNDALGSILGNAPTSSTTTETDEDETNDSTGSVAPEGDAGSTVAAGEGEEGEQAQDGEEGDDESGDEEGESGQDGEVSLRRPDGTFKSKEEIEAEKAAKAGGEKPAKEPAKKPEDKTAQPKAKDPVNDPIPDTLKKETRERMEAVIKIAKEAQETVAHQNQLFEAISSTGATPEEFGQMIGYMRLVHSDKPEDLENAFKILNDELRGLSIRLGKPAAGFDVLSEHSDLSDAVEAGTITRAHANEIALARAKAAQVSKATAVTEGNAATVEQARTQAIADLDELGRLLASVDPQYAEKYAIVVPKLKAEFAKGEMHPSKWKAYFQQEYAKVKVTPPARSGAVPSGQGAAPPSGQPSGGTKPQPLRANKQPTGEGQKQAGSMLDAVNLALAGMGK